MTRRVARALAGLLFPGALVAQGIRISGATTIQLVQLRPLVIDSVPASLVPGTGEVRTNAEGVPAICPTSSSICQFEASGNRISVAPVLQELTIAGWGLGEGLSFHSDLRARAQIGSGGFVYPRTNDHFDFVDLYAQLDRDTWSGRVGRQWISNGLGMYAFDGVDGLVRHDALSVEGWTGRALVAGLEEPFTSGFLAAADNLPPQQEGYAFGARARFRPDALNGASLTYQRVLVADRSGLYSERAAFDGSSRQFGVGMDLGLVYDFATGDWNEARLRFETGGAQRTIRYSVEARHSRPYFDLWTIWGAFSPVGFDEGRASVDWRPTNSAFSYSVHGAYRTYAPTNTATGISLFTNGWRAGADVNWRGTANTSASASYDVDVGTGASATDARAGLRWTPNADVSLGADAMVNQTIYEFRVGTGRIYGLAADAAVPLKPDVHFVAALGVYQHVLTNGAPGPDWSQHRGSIRIEWMLGPDPGMGGKVP